jgi:hypothetical protein
LIRVGRTSQHVMGRGATVDGRVVAHVLSFAQVCSPPLGRDAPDRG